MVLGVRPVHHLTEELIVIAQEGSAAIEFDGSILTLRFLLPSTSDARMEKLELEIYEHWLEKA